MKTKNLLFLLAIASITFFASCNKDDNPSPLTKDEAAAALTALEGDYTDIIAGLDDATGPSVQSSFNNFGFPSIPVSQVAGSAQAIQQELFSMNLPAFAKGGYEQDPYVSFDFNALKGTWTYTDGWSKTSSDPTDQVVLIIPYGEGGTATMTYSDFQTKTNGVEIYVSHLKAELKISTQVTPVMSWEYTSLQSSTGNSNTFVFTFGDYTKTKTWSYSGPMSAKLTSYAYNYTLSTDWKKNGVLIFAKSVNASYTYNSADQSFTRTVTGDFQVNNIVVKWNINFDQTTDLSDPNNYITITVWTADGAKVGDIIYKPVLAKTNYEMYIVFTDGTDAPLGDYLDYLGSDLDNFTWFLRYYGMDK